MDIDSAISQVLGELTESSSSGRVKVRTSTQHHAIEVGTPSKIDPRMVAYLRIDSLREIDSALDTVKGSMTKQQYDLVKKMAQYHLGQHREIWFTVGPGGDLRVGPK